MGLRAFKYYLLLPLFSLTKSTNNKSKRRVEKNKVRMNIKDRSIKSVQNQSEHIIYQSTKYSEALISAYNKQYNYRSNVLERMK